MKSLVFFSNFLTHHQTPLCEEFLALLGTGFRFVSTVPINTERTALGYRDLDHECPYVLRAYESAEAAAEADELARTCDVAIVGSAPDRYLAARCALGKPTFRYSERIFKRGLVSALSPRVHKYLLFDNYLRRNSGLHLLCAGAYVYGDYMTLPTFRGRAFKWGYFTETRTLDPERRFRRGEGPLTLLWVARFIALKHPEHALAAAGHLMERGIDFRLVMVGAGEILERTARLAESAGLGGKVSFPGAMPPEKVRDVMEAADIFLFTSDRNEGWGAVMNEAMNAGCAVVASDAVGSVPYLVRDGVNGMVYRDGDLADLCAKTHALALDAGLRRKLGENAYRTMTEEWCPEVAAARFVELAESLSGGGRAVSRHAEGPCSPEDGSSAGAIAMRRRGHAHR